MSRQVLRRAARPLARAATGAGAAAGVLVLAATAAGAASGDGSQSGVGLTFVQTLLLYVGAPVAIFVLIALVVVGPSLGKGARHRTGASLETGPIWVDPAGVQRTPADTVVPDGPGAAKPGGATEQGGTSARW